MSHERNERVRESYFLAMFSHASVLHPVRRQEGDAPVVRETSSKRSGYSVSPRSPLKDNSIGSVHEVYELTGLILSCRAVAG